MEKPVNRFEIPVSFQLFLFNVVTSKFKNIKELKNMSSRKRNKNFNINIAWNCNGWPAWDTLNYIHVLHTESDVHLLLSAMLPKTYPQNTKYFFKIPILGKFAICISDFRFLYWRQGWNTSHKVNTVFTQREQSETQKL